MTRVHFAQGRLLVALGFLTLVSSACSDSSPSSNADPDGIYEFGDGSWVLVDNRDEYDKWTSTKNETIFVNTYAHLTDGLSTELWCQQDYAEYNILFTSGGYTRVTDPESVNGAPGWWWWVANNETHDTNYTGYFANAPRGLNAQLFRDGTDMGAARAAEILRTLKFR